MISLLFRSRPGQLIIELNQAVGFEIPVDPVESSELPSKMSTKNLKLLESLEDVRHLAYDAIHTLKSDVDPRTAAHANLSSQCDRVTMF